MSRRMIAAGNWKMNLGLAAARSLAEQLASGVTHMTAAEVIVCPPFPWLLPVRDALAGSSVMLGAQNCHTETSGAFTGEVSPTMLAEVAQYVIVGHSERRHVFGESDDLVGRKALAALGAGLRPILCVGELLDERRANSAQNVVARQLDAGLAGIGSDQLGSLVVAYEPVWAIGTGVAATPGDAQEMCAMIRGWLTECFGQAGGEVPVLYGGSVTADNAAELFGQPDVDGGLVGGASLRAESFLGIVEAARAAAR